nr:M10 family metallopeptidase C-terminal domain-containing protein [Microvirga puerhi]
MYDIAALQYLYGANFNTNNTDTVYKWTPERQTFVNGVEVGYDYHIFETIWDGGGIDTYDFSSFDQDMTIDLNPGAWSVVSTSQLAPLGDGHLARGNVFNALQYNGDPRSLIENAIGAIGNDKISGNVADNRLDGSYGNDTLFGGDGNDSLNGGDGNDSLIGGSGNDAIYGGAGDDIVYGGAGADSLNGGAGRNTLSYLDAQGGVTVKLWANSVSGDIAQGDVISGFENVSGGAGGDWLEGDANDNILDGGAGGDLLLGLGGNDLLFGREGNDTLIADWGTDILEGGSGSDLFAIWATTQHAVLNDFKHGEDHIQLSTNLFAGFAALRAAAVQQGDDVLISRTGLDILLKHVQLSTLTASDFQFV